MDTQKLLERLSDAIKMKYELKKNKKELSKKIDEKCKLEQYLHTIIQINEQKTIIKESNTHILAGNAQYRLSVSNIGTLPKKDFDLYHNKNVIYPINYTMRRRFKSHKFYTRKPGKIFYECKISEYPNLFEIKTNDGYTWKGNDIWDDFKNSFDQFEDYNSIDDFFGLTHPTILELIENLGDVSVFKNYIQLKNRSRDDIKNSLYNIKDKKKKK